MNAIKIQGWLENEVWPNTQILWYFFHFILKKSLICFCKNNKNTSFYNQELNLTPTLPPAGQ